MRKIIFLTIAIIYLVVAYIVGGTAIFFKVLLFLLLPVACIWSGDVIVRYKRSKMGTQPLIKDLAGCLVKFIGWILLLLPGVLVIISIVTVKR
jgi:hypothetical protein